MMKEMKTGVYTHNEETYTFNFATSLTFANKTQFVASVTSLLVGEGYYSVLRDLVFDIYLIDIFTDVDIDDIKKSKTFIEDAEQFLEETNIVNIVKANMEIGLLEELNTAVDLDIQYRTGIHPNPLNEALASLFSTLEEKVNEIDLTSMMGMAEKFTGMTGELTPESIVNAYINSDIHKENLAEIEETKKSKTMIAENLDKAIKEVNAEAKKKTNKKK